MSSSSFPEAQAEVPEFPLGEDLVALPGGYYYEEHEYVRLPEGYSGFNRIFDEDRRKRLQQVILRAAEQLGLAPDEIFLAGFKGPQLTEDVDRMKLDDPNIGAGLSTDNLIEQHRPEPDSFDDRIQAIAKRMLSLEETGELDDTTRQRYLAKIVLLRQEKAERTPSIETGLEGGWPVYYFTTIDGVLDTEPEDNPLAYSVDDKGRGQVGVYDRKFLEENGYRSGHLSELSMRYDNQEVVAATNEVVKSSLRGIVTFNVTLPQLH